MNELAGLYWSQGYNARAEPIWRQALEIAKEALGEKHPEYATILNNLGLLYYSKGDYARAEPLYRQALDIRKQALGEKHPEYAKCLNNLAMLYYSQGDYARAAPLLGQALALGEKDPDYATRLNNLALLYESQGDHARAEPLYRQALEIRKQALGEKHPDYANSLHSLAGLYGSQGDLARAEPLYRQALEIVKQILGEKHPHYAVILNNLAMLYRSQGDHARAEPLCQQALEITKQALGEKHPDNASSMNSLASLYHLQGDYARAEPLYRRASEIRKLALGEKHPDYYVHSLINLAGLYHSLGDQGRAEPLVRQSLSSTRQHLDLTAAIQSERQQLCMSESLRYQLDAFLSIAPGAKVAGPSVYAPVLSWKGAVFLRRRQLALADDEPLAAELRSVTSRLATLVFATPDPKQREAFQRQIAELSEKKERLEADLAQKSAEFRKNRELARLTPEQLQKSLPAGSVLVDFLEYRRHEPDPKQKGKLRSELHLMAFVVSASRGVPPGPSGDIVYLDLGPIAPSPAPSKSGGRRSANAPGR